MALIFRRVIRATVAGVTLEGIRMHIRIERPHGEPVTGQIRAWNLSRDTERRIIERGAEAVVEAGYEGNVATVFQGAIERKWSERKGNERTTIISLSNAIAAANRISGLTNRSYENESVRQIVMDLVSDLGLQLGNIDAIPAESVVVTWTWPGPAWAGLVSLCRIVGVTPYEDDGVVMFDIAGVATTGGDFLLSPETGMIGSPTFTDEGAEVHTFLNPMARPGGIARVESERMNGEWKISGISHDGDNWTGQFTTHWQLTPIVSVGGLSPVIQELLAAARAADNEQP